MTIEFDSVDNINQWLSKNNIVDRSILNRVIPYQNPQAIDYAAQLLWAKNITPYQNTLTDAGKTGNPAIIDQVLRLYTEMLPVDSLDLEFLFEGAIESQNPIAINHVVALLEERGEEIPVICALESAGKSGNIIIDHVVALLDARGLLTDNVNLLLDGAIASENPIIIDYVMALLDSRMVAPDSFALHAAVKTGNAAILAKVDGLFQDRGIVAELDEAILESAVIGAREKASAIITQLYQILKDRNIAFTAEGLNNVYRHAVDYAKASESTTIAELVVGILLDNKVEPQPDIIASVIATMNPKMIGMAASLPPITLSNGLAHLLLRETPPIHLTQQNDLITTLKAYVTYKELSENHPLREQPLSHIINVPGADEDFLHRWEDYKVGALGNAIHPGNLPRNNLATCFPLEIARHSLQFLTPQDIENLALTNTQFITAFRNNAAQASHTTASGFSAQKDERQRVKQKEEKEIQTFVQRSMPTSKQPNFAAREHARQQENTKKHSK